jgi:molybdopterin-guanine dinucleotide biosynthesis protein B
LWIKIQSELVALYLGQIFGLECYGKNFTCLECLSGLVYDFSLDIENPVSAQFDIGYHTGICAGIAIDIPHFDGHKIGVDFALGYPKGFAPRLTSQPQARAVWHWLAGQITDSPANLNNRFAVADQINRQFGGQGPFWGHPQGQSFAHLSPRKRVDYAALGLAERREVELVVPRAQPVWKLFTTGSVGGQSLMGLPMIHRLATQHGASVWPFDAPSSLTVAEVYPSLLAPAVTEALGPKSIKDEVQVRLLAQSLWRVGKNGDLAGLLAEAPAKVRAEEGWILGARAAATLLAAL